MDLLSELRRACALVADSARHVRIRHERVGAYAAALPLELTPAAPDPDAHLLDGTAEELSAFWLTLDAINFGSGWFPTLRKRQGRSGYFTIATGVRERFEHDGPWSAEQLATITPAEVAATLGQDSEHELMALFAASLNDLGERMAREFGGRFSGVVDSAGGSAVVLVERLARWKSFEDTSRYTLADGSTHGAITLPFLKRAQIAAADLAAAGVAGFRDLERLTMFADNLVPHVLRLDGVLRFDSSLVQRIERQQLIEHGSPEEVEIRAAAVYAVELIAAARPGTRAVEIDNLLWNRGQDPRYKARPRHRTRSMAY